MDDVTVTRTVTTHPNQEPWMKAGVRSQLKIPDSAFRSGDVSTQSRKEKLQF